MKMHPDVTFAETPGGVVLLNGRTGRYWQLNATGSRILRGLLDGMSQEQVAGQLVAEHAITFERATADVAGLVEELRGRRMVRK